MIQDDNWQAWYDHEEQMRLEPELSEDNYPYDPNDDEPEREYEND